HSAISSEWEIVLPVPPEAEPARSAIPSSVSRPRYGSIPTASAGCSVMRCIFVRRKRRHHLVAAVHHAPSPPLPPEGCCFGATMVMVRVPEWRLSTVNPLYSSNGFARLMLLPNAAGVLGHKRHLRMGSGVSSSSSMRDLAGDPSQYAYFLMTKSC